MTISQPCAVIYSPDDAMTNQLMEYFGDPDFGFIFDEKTAYMHEALYCFENLRIPVTKVAYGNLTFIKTNGEEVPIDTDDIAGFWGVILFNGKDDPLEMDMENIEELGMKASTFMK